MVPKMTTFPVSTRAHAPQAICKRHQWFRSTHAQTGGGGDDDDTESQQRRIASATHNVGSGEDDGEAEGRDDDARCEEDGQLLAGVAGRVCVIHHSPGDAVRDRGEDVEEEEEQRPVFAAGAQEIQINPQLRALHTMTRM